MDDKIKEQLKVSLSLSSSSSVSMVDEEEVFLYETIEAPKFVDFTRPNHFCPDDRFWFCSRVGCDRKHEEEMDSEAIYKNFVLRVMAARSPNVRLRKALIRKSTSETKKCPLSAPPKRSKSRLPRLALASSISKKLISDAKGTTKIPSAKPSSTPKARVKHVAAKYMTSPRKNKPASRDPNAFRSVRNPKRTSITIPKNKVVAKALVFNSPRKARKGKNVVEETGTPITKLCEGIKKLEIASHKKANARNQPKECKIIRKMLPSDSLRKKPSSQKAAKTQQDAKFSISVKNKKRQNEEKTGETELHDGKTKAGSAENSDSVSENTLMSDNVSSEDNVSMPENHVEVEARKKDEKSSETKANTSEDEPENHKAKILGELTTKNDNDDDKENVSKSDDIRNLNGGDQMTSDAPLKLKIPRTVEKKLKENCSVANGTQGGMKYKKLKTTNPKPFRLRTDERGILKDTTTTLAREVNSHESTTTVSENSQCTTNGASENSDKRTQINKRAPIKSKYKVNPKEVETKLDRGVCSGKSYIKAKSSFMQKQLTKPQREVVSHIKTAPLRAPRIATTQKQKDSEKRSNVVDNPTKKESTSLKLVELVKRPTTIPREPNFQSLHKPKGCTKNVECSVF